MMFILSFMKICQLKLSTKVAAAGNSKAIQNKCLNLIQVLGLNVCQQTLRAEVNINPLKIN